MTLQDAAEKYDATIDVDEERRMYVFSALPFTLMTKCLRKSQEGLNVISAVLQKGNYQKVQG